MILQRMSQAIKRQDWFQVTIELFIVMVGIFLGLQVQEWNERREAMVDEQRYIGYLMADLENTINYLESQDNFYQSQLLSSNGVLKLLKQDQ